MKIRYEFAHWGFPKLRFQSIGPRIEKMTHQALGVTAPKRGGMCR
jgi:hypothetical protein